MDKDIVLINAHAKNGDIWLPIDPRELEQLRNEIKAHIEKLGSLSGLIIEPFKPPKGMPFQFVHSVPKLPDIAKEDKGLWYRCSYCQRNRQFKTGKIVYCSDKELRLIGDTCWRKHVDLEEWQAAKEDFSIYQRRRQFEDLKERYAPAVITLRDTLRDSRNQIERVTNFINGFASNFRTTFPILAAAFDKALKNNRALTVDSFVTLINGKTERRVETVFYFSGERALRQEPDSIITQWNRAFTEICRAERHFNDTDWENLPNKKFAIEIDIFKTHCRNGIDFANTVDARIKAILTFLGTNNIEGIIRWTNHNNCDLQLELDGKFVAISRGLKYIKGQHNTEIYMPAYLQPVPLDGLEQPQTLLNKG